MSAPCSSMRAKQARRVLRQQVSSTVQLKPFKSPDGHPAVPFQLAELDWVALPAISPGVGAPRLTCVMDEHADLPSGDKPATDAERLRARAEVTASVAAVKEFLGERGTLVDVRGLSEMDEDLLRRAIVRYAIALRMLQESPESVMLNVKRLVQEGSTPELIGARRRLVNEAVTWAMKAYFNAAERQN
jgi:hypothetical protein